VALKTACLFLTFGEATCPRSLFLGNSSFHANTIGGAYLTAWMTGFFSVSKRGILIIAKGGG